MAPAPDVIGWLKCPMGKSVLDAHAGTPREKRRRVTAKAKTTTTATLPAAPTPASPKAKKTRQLTIACQEPEVFSDTAQDNSRETLFFDDLLCCVTSMLSDIPEEHLSSMAGQPADLFLLDEEAAPRPCGHPAAANKSTGRKGAQVLVSSTKTHQGHVDGTRPRKQGKNIPPQSALR